MKILITGSNGLLGQKLVYALRNDASVECIATARGENRLREKSGYTYATLDLTHAAAVDAVFAEARPEAVIHTAAMTNVDACELDPPGCLLQNVVATEHLVRAAVRHGSHFILLSTDFIFDGLNGPYREEDVPAPLSVYGRSKLESERIVMNAGLAGWGIARTIIV